MAKCNAPWRKKGESMDLPCGRCYDCKKTRISGWSFRLQKEYERSTEGIFLTLTINPEHMNISDKGLMTLRKQDVQAFMKKLRKLNQGRTLKYYACGEYGGKTKRPHYHIILYNADPETIEKAWTKGEFHIGTLTPASCGYTLKYISKPSRVPMWDGDDRLPEFSLMSKKLGDNYLTEKIKNWHDADIMERMYVPYKDGKRLPMPRYYKEKLYTKEQREHIGAYVASKLSTQDSSKQDIAKAGLNKDIRRTNL